MTTPLDRMRTAWQTEGRLALHRAVEEMAREGATRADLDAALDALLDEARAAGVDEDKEEEIMGVGDRLSGWCLASRRIVTRTDGPSANGTPPAPTPGFDVAPNPTAG